MFLRSTNIQPGSLLQTTDRLRSIRSLVDGSTRIGRRRRRVAHVMFHLASIVALISFISPQLASAQGLPFDFHGSLGKGRHQRYVPPLANPLFNETPYITTELRPIFFYNDIPNDFLTSGGEIKVVAAEIRIALTERLGFIATKDGYADANFDKVLPDTSGFANFSLGFKYAVISRPRDKAIMTVGIEYETTSGNIDTGGIGLQGDGDGFVDLFLTGAKAFNKLGIQGSIGANLAIDDDADSSMLHYSLHADYEVIPKLFPLLELNGFTTIDKGERTVGDFEGVDLIHFGSTDSGTVITLAGGLRFRANEHIQLGLGYETPITDREDILNWRVYVDLVLSF